MKTAFLHILSAAALVTASTGIAFATTSAQDPYENFSSSWTRATPASHPFAMAAPVGIAAATRMTPATASRTITVDATQSVVSVEHMTAVKFVDGRGQSFVWQSAGPGTFPLKSIAPAGFDAAKVWVAVVHPSDHTTR